MCGSRSGALYITPLSRFEVTCCIRRSKLFRLFAFSTRKYLRAYSPSVAASGSLQTRQWSKRLGSLDSARTRTSLYRDVHRGHAKSTASVMDCLRVNRDSPFANICRLADTDKRGNPAPIYIVPDGKVGQREAIRDGGPREGSFQITRACHRTRAARQRSSGCDAATCRRSQSLISLWFRP